jgi:hypothetical protein
MSQHSRFVLASLLTACSAALPGCSGSDNQALRDRATGHEDAALDGATEHEPEQQPDAASNAEADADVSTSTDAADARADASASPDVEPIDAAQMDAAARDAEADAASQAPADAAVDAGAVDSEGGEGDAAIAPDASTRVRLTLTRAGAPVPRAYVVYHGVDPDVLGVADTDAQGVARTELEVQALTVLIPAQGDASNINLFTYFGVQPGDDLRLELPGAEDVQTSYALNLSPHPGATRYEAGGGPNACLRGATDGAETRLSLTNPVGCLAPTGNAVLVSAYSLVRDVPLVSAYALASGLAAPAQGATTEVQVGAFQPYQDVHLVGLNAPAEPFISVGLWALLGAQQLPLVAKAGRPELSASAPDVEFAAPSFAFDAFLARAEYFVGSTQTQLSLRTATSATGDDLELDFADALPQITEFLVDESAVTRPYVYWTSDAATTRDAYLFEVRLHSRDSGVGVPVIWAALVPPGLRRVRFPTLPPELTASIPSAATYWWQTERISQLADTTLDGYEAVRRRRLVYISGGAHLLDLPLHAPGHREVSSRGLLR